MIDIGESCIRHFAVTAGADAVRVLQCRLWNVHLNRIMQKWTRWTPIAAATVARMSDSLREKAERLRRIGEGEEPYDGNGKPAEQARRYHHEVILPEAVERIRQMRQENPSDPVDVLISLSGFSPETTVFAFEFLRPQRLTVIVSRTAVDGVDVIADHLDLRQSRFNTTRVDPTDPVDIYNAVKRAAKEAAKELEFAGEERKPHIVIDITGGKKAMSAGAALAASQLDLPLCYIDGEFDSELRQFRPGTDELVILGNPSKLFGDKEMESALLEFKLGHYHAACQRLERIAATTPEPARARFGQDLAGVYEAWCQLNFKELAKLTSRMRDRLDDRNFQPSAALSRRLALQLDYLDELAARPDGSNLLLNFYLLGKHYQDLGRHDFAALFYYRAIEKLFSLRLEEGGFSCTKPDWSLLNAHKETLAERYESLASALHGVTVEGLPFRVGLFDAVLLLHVLDDRLIRLLCLSDKRALSHLKRMTEARNQSVLAHGTETVTLELSEKLANFARRGLRSHWKLHPDGRRVDDRIAELRFVPAI